MMALENPDTLKELDPGPSPVVSAFQQPHVATGLATALNIPREHVEAVLQEILAELQEAKAVRVKILVASSSRGLPIFVS